jgi:hypothetical protein
MYYKNDVISYLQANNILALKLDHALSGVGKAVLNQIDTIGAGAKRALYYASCFTDEYQDVCQQMLMAVNVHIAASTLTRHGFALAVASSVSIGMNLSLNMQALTGHVSSGAVMLAGVYGVVQKAADSAYRLAYISPAYYAALYAQELEMMYFLIEPVFEQAGALKTQWASDSDIADVITRMIR